MVKHHVQRSHLTSLHTAVLFVSIVCIIIGIAIAVKIIKTIERSIYDEQHQFVLLIAQPKQATLADFNPQDNTLSLLYISNPNQELITKDLQISVDATIPTQTAIHSHKEFSNVLLSSVFLPTTQSNPITWYDIIQLYLFSNKMAQANVTELSVTVPVNDPQRLLPVQKLFADKQLERDNVPIQIINGSGIVGIGKRLETMLNAIGCNVIDVRTNQTTIPASAINYYGTMSYTVTKLDRLIQFKNHQSQERNLATIQIVIGTDSKQITSF